MAACVGRIHLEFHTNSFHILLRVVGFGRVGNVVSVRTRTGSGGYSGVFVGRIIRRDCRVGRAVEGSGGEAGKSGGETGRRGFVGEVSSYVRSEECESGGGVGFTGVAAITRDSVVATDLVVVSSVGAESGIVVSGDTGTDSVDLGETGAGTQRAFDLEAGFISRVIRPIEREGGSSGIRESQITWGGR